MHVITLFLSAERSFLFHFFVLLLVFACQTRTITTTKQIRNNNNNNNNNSSSNRSSSMSCSSNDTESFNICYLSLALVCSLVRFPSSSIDRTNEQSYGNFIKSESQCHFALSSFFLDYFGGWSFFLLLFFNETQKIK
jgi:hypothetical protein